MRTTTTAEMCIPGELWKLHGRENSIYDCNHSNLRSRVPGNLPGGTSPRCFTIRNFTYPLSKPGIRIFPTLGPQRAKKGTIFIGGLLTPMGELFLLMVKPWLGGVLSLVHLMEGFLSCLVRSSQPKHTSLMQGPESTPTTLLSSRVLLRRFLLYGPLAWLSVVHTLAFL